MKKNPWLRVTSLLLALGASAALAQPRVPYFSVSGDLRDSVGNPVNGPTDLVVRLYDSSAAPVGNALHAENFPATQVTRGQFQLQVGTTVALQLPRLFNRPDAGAELWVGIQVSGEGEMAPRLRVNSAPWALSADWSGLTSVPATFPPGSHQHPGTDVTTAVSNANNVPWAGVTGKPATFPPSAHQHPGTDVTSVVANATNAAAVPWAGVSGKPPTFPPAAHQHPGTDVTSAVANANAVPWAGVTGKPAVLVTGVTASAPLASSGGAAPNLTLGTVGIANGGTGSTTQNFVDLSSNQTIGGNKNFTRVGIGVAGPTNELEIAAATPAVVLTNTPANYGSIYFYEGSSLMGMVEQISPTWPTVPSRRNTLEVESTTGDVALRTGGVDRLRVEANGNVSIGVATPTAALHVGRDVAGGNGVARFENTNAGASLGATGIVVTAEGRTLELNLSGSASILAPYAQHVGYALLNTNGTTGLDLTTTNATGVIRFFPAGLATERMRLTSAGNLGIGTATPGSRLDLGGGCMTGTLCSDARLKSNIRPLREDVLSRVMKLAPSTFVWKGRPEQKKVIGVIAQQVETVFPEVVGTSADGTQKGIECTGLTAIALKAIQEQQVQLKAQQAQIDALQRKLEVLSRSRR